MTVSQSPRSQPINLRDCAVTVRNVGGRFPWEMPAPQSGAMDQPDRPDSGTRGAISLVSTSVSKNRKPAHMAPKLSGLSDFIARS
jgi:hypothetical protein